MGHHAQILVSADIAKRPGWTARKLAALAKTHDGETFVRTGKAGRPFRGYRLKDVKSFERGFAVA